MKKFLIVILMLTLVCGCSTNEKQKTEPTIPEYQELMNTNEYVIIDVRTEAEYESGHVVGAINIPVDQIDETIDLEKDKLIFVYCLSGGRSHQADQILTSLGFNVYDLGAYESIDLPKE